MKLSKQEIGSILRDLRESNGYTQKEVAQRFGRTQQIIGHWETGYSQPDAGTLFALCDFYGADISQVFGFAPPAKAVTLPDFSDNEISIILAYRQASEDDKNIVDSALRKYIDCPASLKGDAEKMA